MAVRKRGSIWWYDFRCRIHRARHRGSLKEARTKAAAEQAEAKLRTECFEIRYGKELRTPPLREWINKTYLTWARSNKRTFYDDALICKVICEHFGKMRLSDVSPLHVERFKKARCETPTQHGNPRAPATVNRELAVLSKIFALAVDAGHLESNPVRRVKMLRHDNSRTRYLDEEEERELLEELKEPLRSIVIIALNTGMRRGEILALRWHNLDFSRGIIYVTETKTARNRSVPMNKTAREIFNGQKRRSELVFISPRTGAQLVEIKKGFTAACRRAGIEDFRFHDLRHTAATRMGARGAEPSTLCEIFGWSDIRMALRYTHAVDARKRQAVESLTEKEKVVTIWSQKGKGQARQLAVNS